MGVIVWGGVGGFVGGLVLVGGLLLWGVGWLVVVCVGVVFVVCVGVMVWANCGV